MTQKTKSISKMNKKELITYIDDNSEKYNEGYGFSGSYNCRSIDIHAYRCGLSDKAVEILFDEQLNHIFWLDVEDEMEFVQTKIDECLGREINQGVVTKHNVGIGIFGRNGKHLCLHRVGSDYMFEDLEEKTKEDLQNLANAIKVLYEFRQFMISSLEYYASDYEIKTEEYIETKTRRVLEPITA